MTSLAGQEGDEKSEDEEAGGENSWHAGPRSSEFGKDLFGRTGEGGPSGLHDEPKSSADKAMETHQPMTLARCIRMASCRRTEEEQSEMGLCVRSVGHDALPDVRAFTGEGHRANDKQGSEGDDRRESQRPSGR